jgi:protein-tyrosine phosphatase
LSVPFPDGEPIPPAAIERCIGFLAGCRQKGESVFVHCAAGQNRSPTVIWLYLIATGMEPEQATEVFDGKTLDGVLGHPKLVGAEQVAQARALRAAVRGQA